MKLASSELALLLSCFFLLGCGQADFSDQCPSACKCKWANGKREADCQNAGFNAVPTHLHHEIQILRMSGNYVRKLGKEVFKNAGLLNLQRIYMNNCHVQEVHVDAFRELKILVELDLSHNNITDLSPRIFYGNERLQTLSLHHNQIKQLHANQFPRLRHLKSIDISHNFLTSIDKKAFSSLDVKVESIFINDNELKTMSDEVFLRLTNLKSLQLHSNPWVCDCKLKNFRDWVVERGLDTYSTSCVEPERLADKPWSGVHQKDFACKPAITVPQSVVFSQPGANVTLSCFIWGSPIPDAKWVLKGRIVNNNTVPAGGSAADGQQFYIHEEGGIERWFNLTITNVGLESVADYTCVAVNAGGVMEENISLTFEEPEPVGLPGGKKEESSLAIIIGAAAGGFLFVVVLLLILCCCCCRRRIKHHSSTPSSASRTPERQGSFMAFGDSNSSQKLISGGHMLPPPPPTGAAPPRPGGRDFASPGGSSNGSSTSSPTSHSHNSGAELLHLRQQGGRSQSRIGHYPPGGGPLPPPPPPTGHSPLPPPPSLPGGSGSGDQLELKEIIQKAHNQRPKAMMVSSNGIDGGNFHSLAGDPADHYPDLLDIPNRYQPGGSGTSAPAPPPPPPAASPAKHGNQPLNPAALVVPPTPPLQFPHQFPHLIHSSRGSSNGSGQQQGNPVTRSHSCENAADPSTPPQPLLSPPSQFSGPPQSGHEMIAPNYVTLPRGRQLQPRGSGQHVDWNSFNDVVSANSKGSRYDGTGPRTTATGGLPVQGSGKPITFSLNRPCSTIPEGDELDKHPSQRGIDMEGGQRDSSGSEVTIVDDNLSGFCEPFGKAQPPPPLANKQGKNRDSIASNASSDMDGMLGNEPKLRGILKGGTLNKAKPISFENPTFQKGPPPPAGSGGGGGGGGGSGSPVVTASVSSTPTSATTGRRRSGMPNPMVAGLKKMPPPQPPKVPTSSKDSIPSIRISSSTPTGLDV